jgi:hypothetical protein
MESKALSLSLIAILICRCIQPTIKTNSHTKIYAKRRKHALRGVKALWSILKSQQQATSAESLLQKIFFIHNLILPLSLPQLLILLLQLFLFFLQMLNLLVFLVNLLLLELEPIIEPIFLLLVLLS